MSLLLVQNMMGDLLMPNLFRQLSDFFHKDDHHSSDCSKLAGDNFELDFWTIKNHIKYWNSNPAGLNLQFEVWRLKGIKTNKSELWNHLTYRDLIYI